MTKPDLELTPLELSVLYAILRKRPKAYGVSIYEEMPDIPWFRKQVAMASIYATLGDLETRKLVTSRKGEATAERGGRAKMYFDITGEGQRAVRHSLTELRGLTAGLQGAIG